MAITQGMCTSFKVGILNANFNFGTGTTQVYKMALFTSLATLNASTTAYSTSDEVVGTGYTAGGNILTVSQVPTSTGTTAFINFADTTWTSSAITARGALVYLANGTTNPAVYVLDFGGDKISTAGNFTVQFPVADATNAILRIA
jgi:hypothetical protein